MTLQLAEFLSLTLGLALTMMLGHSIGRLFGLRAAAGSGRAAMARLARFAAGAGLALAAGRAHGCGTGAIALDQSGTTLLVVSGRKTRLLAPGTVVACHFDRHTRFGRTWHRLHIQAGGETLVLPFRDYAACSEWSRIVNSLTVRGQA